MNVGAATIQCLNKGDFSYRGDKLNVDVSWGDYASFTASLKNGANPLDNEGICGGRYEHSSSDRKEIRSTLMRRLPQTSPVAFGFAQEHEVVAEPRPVAMRRLHAL